MAPILHWKWVARALRTAVATSCVLLGACAFDGVSRRPGLAATLDAEIPKLLAEHAVPSVAIARIEGGRVVLERVYGQQSAGVPATAATLYNIASMAKPLSAEVILRLASRGHLSLDEPMHSHWVDPDVTRDERHRKLTPRLSLSHQTGFPNWRYETGKVLVFQRAPGERFGYSGEGYEYVARFAEKKTRVDFERHAQALVFDPAGMASTSYTRQPWFAGRIALPTASDGKVLNPEVNERWIASDDVYTTIGDYARFVVSLMHYDASAADRARQRETVQVSRKEELCPPAKARPCPEQAGAPMATRWCSPSSTASATMPRSSRS